MTTLADIGTVLQAAGVGTVGVDLFLGDLTASPTFQMAIRETGGYAPIRDLDDTGIVVDQPRFQVICRGAVHGYAVARARIETAYRALDAVLHTTVNTVDYYQMQPVQPPFLVAYDELERPILACNFQVALERA